MAFFARLLVPAGLLLLLACAEPPAPPALPPELAVGAPVEPAPGAPVAATWWIPLAPGEAFRATLDQLGTDVEIELRRPGGEVLITIDQPIGRFGPEPLCFVDPEGTGVILEIRPYGEPRAGEAGHPYRLVLERRGPAGEKDRLCWQALRLCTRVAAREEDTAEMLAEAIRAREAWRAAGEPFQAAVAEVETAVIAGRVEGVPAEIRHREAALALLEGMAVKDPGAKDPGVIHLQALLLFELAVAYRAAGRSGDQEAALLGAQEAYRALGDEEGGAVVLNDLALLARSRGETHRAVELFDQVAETVRRTASPPGSPSLNEAVALLNKGSAEAELGLDRRALDTLGEARGQLAALGAKDREAEALNILGWIHTLAGREEKAVPLFERALEIAVREDLPAVEIAARDRLGTALRRLGRFEEARESYRKALELARETGRRKHEGDVLANLGRLETEAGRPELALDLLTEALGRVEIRANPDARAYVLGALARACRRLGRLDEALGHLEGAVEAIEEQRAIARAEGRRMLGVPLWPDDFDLLVELLVELDAGRPGRGYGRRAFEVAERARARHLAETLQDAEVDLRADADPALLDRERELGERIGSEQARLGERSLAGAGEEELTGIERSIRRLLGELEDVRAEIRRSSPRLAELSDPEPVGVDALQRRLDPETTFVGFQLGEAKSFAFVVSADAFDIVALDRREVIDGLAGAVYAGLEKPGRMRGQLDLTARGLSEKVLGPVWPKLAGRRLVLAPDGPLHYASFAALPRPGAEGGMGGGDLLLDRLEVTTVPSATVLAALADRDRGWKLPESVAVVADPDYPPGDRLPPLPFSRKEAEAILRVGGAERVQLFLGPEARPELVTGGALGRFGVVHFAAHVLIDEEEPQLSHVALSGPLFLHEIYALDLAAEMVVLSGCSSALGEAVEGEGLVGLTRGFFFAGAPRVVVTLWPVDDAATAALMGRFYQALFEGLEPAAALARAQREIRATPDWQDPSYWAGFVLQGAAR